MLDLCAYSQQETLALLDKLSSEVKSIGIPIIVLCNKADRDYVEGLSFQNIDIDVQQTVILSATLLIKMVFL